MNTSKQDTRFLQLLHKWRTGDFTRADEQEMWALAVDDPFRMDTLAGMMEQPELDHEATVTALRAKIREKQPGRMVGFPQILAVAAGLILVFAAIWFFNIRPVPEEKGQMATELHAVGEETSAPTVSVPSPPTEMRRQSAPSGAASTGAAPADAAPAGPSALEVDKMAEEEAPPTFAEVKDDARYDEAGRDIALQKPNPSIVQPPGDIRAQSTNMARPAEIAKQEQSYAKKKRSKDPAPQFDRQQSQDQNAGKADATLSLQSNQPKEGWISFRLNLANNARLTPAALANNVTGTVRLQFLLDASARPVEIKVISGLGHGCDEAAIQLIKMAEWIKVDNQAVTVDVPFVR
jgi:Gram-negative bacterial TonB protein C-terminal